LEPGKEYYQMGEEGNKPDAYELQTTNYMKRLIFRDFTVSTRYPNNIVLVRGNEIDMGVCVISDLRYDSEADTFKVSVSPFVKQGDFYTGVPCNSSDFNIYLVSGGVDHSKRQEVDSKLIVTQFVCLLYEKHVIASNSTSNEATASSSLNDDPSRHHRMLDKTLTSWVCTPLMHSVVL
jgi:hypothetical protein